MKLNDEKGSITLFVVIAMFAFVLFSLSTYTLLSRRNQTQQDLLAEIKKLYENDVDYDEYASYFGGEIIPIYNGEDLKKVASGETIAVNEEKGKIYKFSENATYVLKNDITLTGYWEPIGTESKPFKGFFEGMGCTISGLNINTTNSNQGLFGIVDGGIISNLLVEGTVESTSGSSEYIGGIVGRAENKYTIRNCINRVTVKGNSCIGGIVGGDTGNSENSGETIGKIVNCKNNGIVQGTNNVGGIIGLSNGNIINCANFSEITGFGTCIRGNCRI